MPPAAAGSGISLNAAEEAPGSRRPSEWHWAPFSPSLVFPEPPKVSPLQSFILGSPEALRMQEAQLPHSQASSLLFILICESSPLRNGCATPSWRVPLPTYEKQQLLCHCQTPQSTSQACSAGVHMVLAWVPPKPQQAQRFPCFHDFFRGCNHRGQE